MSNHSYDYEFHQRLGDYIYMIWMMHKYNSYLEGVNPTFVPTSINVNPSSFDFKAMLNEKVRAEKFKKYRRIRIRLVEKALSSVLSRNFSKMIYDDIFLTKHSKTRFIQKLREHPIFLLLEDVLFKEVGNFKGSAEESTKKVQDLTFRGSETNAQVVANVYSDTIWLSFLQPRLIAVALAKIHMNNIGVLDELITSPSNLYDGTSKSTVNVPYVNEARESGNEKAVGCPASKSPTLRARLELRKIILETLLKMSDNYPIEIDDSVEQAIGIIDNVLIDFSEPAPGEVLKTIRFVDNNIGNVFPAFSLMMELLDVKLNVVDDFAIEFEKVDVNELIDKELIEKGFEDLVNEFASVSEVDFFQMVENK